MGPMRMPFMDWTSKIYPDRFALFSLYLIEAERCGYMVEKRRKHISTRTNINKQMKKNITTIFATVLAISSFSLLVGCGGVEVDPDAAANEAAEPTEKDDHVISKVNAVGICGSDLHYYSEGGIGTTSVGKGFVPGHEFSAILLEAIPEMNLEEGEHIAVDPAKPCFECKWCKKGYENLCPYVEFIGAPPFNGAMAQYVSIKKHQIHKIPNHFTPQTAVLLETLGIALHAVDLSKTKFHQ